MSETKTLLERARDVKRRRLRADISGEKIELAIAWLKNDIGFRQLTEAMGYKSSSSAYIMLAIVLREAHRQGFLQIKGAE